MMSKKPNKYQKKIAELEEKNRLLEQQLSKSQQDYQQSIEQLETTKKALRKMQWRELESENMLRMAIDHIPEAVFWKDRHSVYLGCNQHFARIAGLSSPEEIIGKTDNDLPWKPEETRWYQQCDRRVIESNCPEMGIIEPQQQADGRESWLETNKIPLRDAAGNAIGILGTFIDVTEKVVAAAERETLNQKLQQKITKLQETEARLQRLADNLPGLIFQFRLEADGTQSFPYVSGYCRQIYELEPDNFIQAFDLVHQEDIDSLNRAIQISAETSGRFHHEHRIVTASGVLKWVQAIAKPEPQPDGAIVWDGIIIEISDRKQVEIELQAQKQLLRSIYDGVNHPMFVIEVLDNGDFRYVGFNQASEQVTGTTEAEILHKTPEEAFPPEVARGIRENYHRCVSAGSSFGYEECLHFNGKTFWFLTTLNPIKDASGRIFRLVGSALNITDRKFQEQALRSIVEGTVSQTGEAFFRACVKSIAIALDVRYVTIGEIDSNTIQTLAFWSGEDFEDNVRYEIEGTPCADVLQEKHLCRYARSVQSLFPEDTYLGFLGVESYVGLPILDQQGNLLGLIAVLDTKPMEENLTIHNSILEIFAARAGAEIKRMQAEQALREKDAFLQMTLEAGKMACWNWNRHTDRVIWSDGAEGVLGVPVGSLGETLKSYTALIHPEDLHDFIQTVEQTLHTEQEYNTEHRIVLANGEIRWMRATGEIWRNQKGEAIGLMGSLLNDTQRKTVEISLMKSAQQIRQQAQREQLLNQIANQIRTSLDLDRILNTTVQEIQRFLQVDRCHFAWYVEAAESAYWDVVAEVQGENLPSFVGQHPATVFAPLTEILLCHRTLRIDRFADIENPEVRDFMQRLGNQSMLVLPVWNHTEERHGIISCIHHQSVRPWDDREVEFLEAVVAQLAIALNQADLLAQSQARARELEQLLTKLQRTQTQLIQSEKMSSLGQMVAGMAHEINNPVGFIHGNITYAQDYATDLIRLVELYQRHYPEPDPEIEAEIEEIELDFLKQDLEKVFRSMQVGTNRIQNIVKSLRTFSRLDEAEIKPVHLHEGIDSALTMLQTRLGPQTWRPEIETIKEYSELPRLECYAGQLNQVFLNILNNAIDALEDRDRTRTPEEMEQHKSQIRIQTRLVDRHIIIRFIDNGGGIRKEIQPRLFDPFFTTKPVGKGTGLGLSVSYQIITEQHQGDLYCTSQPGETIFTIKLPLERARIKTA